MTTQVSINNIQTATLTSIARPRVTNLQVANSTYVPTGATTVSTSGGYLLLTGTNFITGAAVVIGTTNATSVGFVSSTSLQVRVPAMTAGTYLVYITNPDGSVAIRAPGVTYA
jgi:IPT/TIG domain